MTVERIPFTRTEREGAGGGLEYRERHESFALVGVNRVSIGGGGRVGMFGSHLDSHPTVFRFKLQRAVRVHTNLAYDRFYGDHEAETQNLVEFELTPTQFVELMTSLNMGEGVPCTLRYVDGQRMEDVPDEHETEAQTIVRNFSADMQDIAGSVRPHADRIAEIMAKPSIGKRDRDEVNDLVEKMLRKLSDRTPWILKMFVESTGRLITDGKAQVEAYATSVIMSAGLEAIHKIRARGGEAVSRAVAALTEGHDDE